MSVNKINLDKINLDKIKLDNLKKKLEENSSNAVIQLKTEKNVTLDSLSKILEAGHKEFTEKIGRPMTYSEMREMYG